MDNARTRIVSFGRLLLLVALIASTGCVGAISQLIYVVKGTNVEPAYTGLEDSTVAVVCVSDASAYGPDMLTTTVAQAVAMKMQRTGRDINIVPATTVNDWIDRKGWDESDFVKLGKGVGADKVVAIEIGAYSIHEGSTLYKGRTDLSVTVYDLKKDGVIDFMYGPTEYSFPKNGRPAIQTSDRQFEAFFLANLTEHISHQFCPFDRVDQVARDAMSLDHL
jgi:hypothetical protein